MLVSHWRVFNGKKIVSIAQGEGLVAPAIVELYLPKDAEVIVVDNDPLLGETPSFIAMLERVESIDSAECTFYAHAKGVTPRQQNKSQSILMWRNLMYWNCLADIRRVEEIMSDQSCAGCFLHRAKRPKHPNVHWHFSGTYFWFRHDTLFSNPEWKRIDQNRFGVEKYLGKQLPESEAACLFPITVASSGACSKRQASASLRLGVVFFSTRGDSTA